MAKTTKKKTEKESLLKHKFQHTDFNQWLDVFSQTLHTSFRNNRIELPEDFAKGYVQVGQIEDGLTYRMVNYTLNKDFEVNINPAKDFSIQVHFYKYKSKQPIMLQIGDAVTINEEPSFKVSSMHTSRVPLKRILKKGTSVRGISLMITDDWLLKNVRVVSEANYIKLVNANHLIYVLTAKQEKVLDDLFDKYPTAAVPNLFISTRLIRLLESFLEHTLQEASAKEKVMLSMQDIEGILRVEAMLLEKYDDIFPSITKLAHLANMSESKLKKVFKRTFNMGPFEYYQKNKMHKAKQLLKSRKYSVSEIGSMLGYSNLSNFSSSFKKEFKILPKQYQEHLNN